MIQRLTLLLVSCVLFAISAFGQGDMGTSTKTSDTKTTSASTSTAKAPIFRPTKDQVKQVQSILKDKKLYTGEATGTYNDETREGIKGFQGSNGLKQTGTLNRATLEKFGVTLTDTQKAIPVSQGSYASSADTTKKASARSAKSSSTNRAPVFRASADQIKSAQKILKDNKFYDGEQTGKLDDATRAGLEKYQTANGLKVTGTLNALTLDKMGIALTDAQKATAAAPANTKN